VAASMNGGMYPLINSFFILAQRKNPTIQRRIIIRGIYPFRRREV
jgi:hypothetical protein